MIKSTFFVPTPFTSETIPVAKYMPDKYTTGKIPFVVAFHGNGETWFNSTNITQLTNNNNFDGIKAAGDTHGFGLVTPQFIQAYNWIYDAAGKPQHSWKPEWAGGNYANTVIDWVLKNLPVDPTRLYITGLSGGGGAVWDYVSDPRPELAAKIAAAIPVCGTEQTGLRDWSNARKVPIWAFHGDSDYTIRVGASERQAILSGAKLTIYSGAGHSIWGTTYKDPAVYEWMLSKSRSITSPPTVPVFQPNITLTDEAGKTVSFLLKNIT